jgi:hypothetical protein
MKNCLLHILLFVLMINNSYGQFNLINAKSSDIIAKSKLYTVSNTAIRLFDNASMVSAGELSLDSLIIEATSKPTAVVSQNIIPEQSSLQQNYPNPFNNSTVIRYSVSQNSKVSLRVFDITGREVESLISNEVQSGDQQVHFSSTNLASGMYVYQMISTDNTGLTNTYTKKLMVLK